MRIIRIQKPQHKAAIRPEIVLALFVAGAFVGLILRGLGVM